MDFFSNIWKYFRYFSLLFIKISVRYIHEFAGIAEMINTISILNPIIVFIAESIKKNNMNVFVIRTKKVVEEAKPMSEMSFHVFLNSGCLIPGG